MSGKSDDETEDEPSQEMCGDCNEEQHKESSAFKPGQCRHITGLPECKGNKDDKKPKKPEWITRGVKCMALYSSDNLYYRAVIDDILDEDQVAVTFVGFESEGKERVLLKHLKKMPQNVIQTKTVDATTKCTEEMQALPSESFFAHLEGFEMNEEIRTKYEDYDDVDMSLQEVKQGESQGKKRKGLLDISTCKGSKVYIKKPEKNSPPNLNDTGTIAAYKKMDNTDMKRLGYPKQDECTDEWCDMDGFDDQDMEKPCFSEPAPCPFVPLLLSEPGTHPLIQVPATINCRLREYQRDGVKFLYRRYRDNGGAILGDDMGLGKTVQVIAFLAALLGKTGTKVDVFGKYMNQGKSGMKEKVATEGCFLIVSPSSVLYNWRDELDTWGHFKVKVYHGSRKEGVLEEAAKEKIDVVLTTYDTLRINLSKFNRVSWVAVIMDEVQKLKDPDAQVSVAANALKVKRRFGLTGTPLQNGFNEFWSVLDWANPGCLGSARKFTKEYSKPIKRGQRYDVTKRELAIGRTISKNFQSKIHGQWFLRRTKDLISDQLPQKDERIVFCNLTSFQEEIYVTLLQSLDVQLITKKDNPCDCGSGQTRGHCCYESDENGGSLRSLLMRYLQLLLKAANHTALLMPQVKQTEDQRIKAKAICDKVFARHPEYAEAMTDSSFQTLSDPTYCGKMKVLDQLLRMFEKEKSKVLLFSQSTQLLNILEEYVIGRGMIYSRLDGKTKTSLRPVIVKEFNNNPEIFVCLISTKAGALGLNFTGANVVIIFDPTWNPANDLQAQDRAYRIGQRRDVQVFRLISSGTIEEMIYLRQVYKQQMANIAVKGTSERRYFTGVEGEKDSKGELFGMENLFSYRAEGVSLAHDIIERTDKLEAGLRIEKYKIVAGESDEEVEPDEEEDTNKANKDASEDEDDYDLDNMASQYFVAEHEKQSCDEPSTSGMTLEGKRTFTRTSLSDEDCIQPAEFSHSVQKNIKKLNMKKASWTKEDQRKARLRKYVSELFSCSETSSSESSEESECEDSVLSGEGSVLSGEGSVLSGEGSVLSGEGSVLSGEGSVLSGERSIMDEEEQVSRSKTGRQREKECYSGIDDDMMTLGQTDTSKPTCDRLGKERGQTDRIEKERGQTDKLDKERRQTDKVNEAHRIEDAMFDDDSEEESGSSIPHNSRQRFTRIRCKKTTNRQTSKSLNNNVENERESQKLKIGVKKNRKSLSEPSTSSINTKDDKDGRQKCSTVGGSLSEGEFDRNDSGCHGNGGYLSLDEYLELVHGDETLILPSREREREKTRNRTRKQVTKNTTQEAQVMYDKNRKVEEILSKCGVHYTHANRTVVATSKAESHMTKRAIEDVFELRQFSQQPANCFAAYEASEESDDVAEFTTCRAKSKKQAKHSKAGKETTSARSKATSSQKVIDGTTEVIDDTTVIIGGTPRGIRQKHFLEMSRWFGFASELDFASSVAKQTNEHCRELLKEFYTKSNHGLEGLKYFSAEGVGNEATSKKDSKRKSIQTTSKEGSTTSVTSSVEKTSRKLSLKENIEKRMISVGKERKHKRRGVVFDEDSGGVNETRKSRKIRLRKRPVNDDDDDGDDVDDNLGRVNETRKSRKIKQKKGPRVEFDDNEDDDGDDVGGDEDDDNDDLGGINEAHKSRKIRQRKIPYVDDNGDDDDGDDNNDEDPGEVNKTYNSGKVKQGKRSYAKYDDDDDSDECIREKQKSRKRNEKKRHDVNDDDCADIYNSDDEYKGGLNESHNSRKGKSKNIKIQVSSSDEDTDADERRVTELSRKGMERQLSNYKDDEDDCDCGKSAGDTDDTIADDDDGKCDKMQENVTIAFKTRHIPQQTSNSNPVLKTDTFYRQNQLPASSILDEFIAPELKHKLKDTSTNYSLPVQTWERETNTPPEIKRTSLLGKEKERQVQNNVEDDEDPLHKRSILDDFI